MSTSNEPPSLGLLATLSSPSIHGTRTWQSRAHPSFSKPLLATASSDKSVHVWSLKDFRLLSTISGGHKRSVRCVDWKNYGSPSKRRKGPKGNKVTLATGSFDANVGIWEHNPPNSHTDTAGQDDADELMHDGDAPNDNLETDLTKKTGDDEEWNFTTLLTGPDSEIKSIAFSPPHYSANLLATSSRDKSVWVWEEVEDEEWETIAVCQEHTGDVKCVAWCEGGKFPKRRKGDEDGEEEEERVVGSRELLASGSYDDTIRLWRDVEEEGDWMCVGVLEGHDGTVWDLCWEKYINTYICSGQSEEEIAANWEPRILSCSDDLSVRVWRRELSESEKEKKRNQQMNGVQERGAARLPTIIRPPSNFEKWTLETRLPEVHVRSVYTVDWSKVTGLVVSCGGDGTIAVYQEIPISLSERQTGGADDVVMNGTAENAEATEQPDDTPKSQWIVVATMEAAHDEYEINHVCWARRLDRERRFEDEEIIVSTGDDGDVKIWTLPEESLKSVGG